MNKEIMTLEGKAVQIKWAEIESGWRATVNTSTTLAHFVGATKEAVIEQIKQRIKNGSLV